MSFGATPPPESGTQPITVDPELERIKFEKEKWAKDQEDAKRKAADLAAARARAIAGARTGAANYLTQQGLDSSQYGSDITRAIQEIMGTVAQDDPTPGAYLKDVGKSVYDTLTGQTQNRANRALDTLFTPEYERSRIADSADDATIAAISAEQRNQAEAIINNMLARGVINDAGRSAAEKELDRQSAGVMAQLNALGQGALASGRQSLSDIIGRARSTAASLKPTQTFDPSTYQSEADTAFNDWLSQLGTSIRGKITAPLFDTSSLAAIAGGGQKAQNYRYDPKAAAGIFDVTGTNTGAISGKPSSGAVF